MKILRELIYKIAEKTNDVGALEETLKWGEPAYLTSETKSGTTIRIDWKPKNPNHIGIYVNCSTTLINTFKNMFDSNLKYEATRAILLPIDKPLAKEPLSVFIRMALRYHLDKKS